jgi:hypothetical protein
MMRSHLLSSIKIKIIESFSIDLRALGIFRIFLGLVILWDLFNRLTDLTAHYTDYGVLPREIARNIAYDPNYFSLHMLSGERYFQVFLFIIAIFSAIALLVGFKTRLFTLISWILLVSLHNRNVILLQGGDVLLRMVLLWSIFLPLGKKFSVDNLLNRTPKTIAKEDNLYFSAGSIALISQILFLYLFTVLRKDSPEWTQDYSAIYYTLSIDQFATSFSSFLYHSPLSMKILTAFVFWFEAISVILIISPWHKSFSRTIAIIGLCLLHIGIFVNLAIGFFPFVNFCVLIPLLPKYVLDWIENKHRSFKSIFKLEGLRTHLIKPERNNNVRLLRKTIFWASSSLVTFLLFIVLLNNLFSISLYDLRKDKKLIDITNLLRLDQDWGMFAPAPLVDDGWFIIRGKLKDGEEKDLFSSFNGFDNLKNINWEKPRYVSELYKNDRWRKYFRRLYPESHPDIKKHYCSYLYREWGNHLREGEKIEELEVYYMLEYTLPNYEVFGPQRKLIWKQAID